MTNEINLSILLRTFKRCWWKVVILALVAMLCMAAFTVFFIPKKYSSTMEVYIINANANVDYTTSSLLDAAETLANDYVSIIKGDAMLDKLIEGLAEEGYIGITHKMLRSMIRASSPEQSSIFELSVVDTDPGRAYAVAKQIALLAPDHVTDVAKSDSNDRSYMTNTIYDAIDYFNDKRHNNNSDIEENEIRAYLEQFDLGLNQQDCIAINVQPKAPTSHDSPSLVMNTLVAGIAAALVSYVIFLVFAISRSVITTEEDIKAAFDYPVIGAIPHWSSHLGKNVKGGSYYGKK